MALTSLACTFSLREKDSFGSRYPHQTCRDAGNLLGNASRPSSALHPQYYVCKVVCQNPLHCIHRCRLSHTALRGVSQRVKRRGRGDYAAGRLVVVKAQEAGAGGPDMPVDGPAEKEIAKGSEGVGTAGTEKVGVAARIQRAFSTGCARYFENLAKEAKTEAGVDIASVKEQAGAQLTALKEVAGKTAGVARARSHELLERIYIAKEQAEKAVGAVRQRFWPQFVSWNRWELWQDVKKWDAQRVGALILYALLLGASIRGAYTMVTTPRLTKAMVEKLADEYMESVIPEPTEKNLQKFKKRLWREQMPEGLRVRKHTLGPDGEYRRDPTYVGENPWADSDDEDEPVEKIIESSDLTAEEKEELWEIIAEARAARGSGGASTNTNDEVKNKASISAGDEAKNESPVSVPAFGQIDGVGEPVETSEVPQTQTWQERLAAWEKLLAREKVKDLVDQQTSKFVVPLSHHEIRRNFPEEQAERELQANKKWAFWVARRWWKYRPKLPYTYFLAKVENLEVEAAVYSCDTRKLYVTMKDGFPSEFVVDIPVDPYLYQMLKGCGVETDVLPKSNFSFYGRAFLALLPSVLIIFYIRAWQYRAKEKFSEKIYDLLKMNREHLILPEDAAEKARSEYKDVVVGGDVWMVLEEIMTYMRNPMKYHSKRVKIPRGILISGPPGTGKTLLARAIARESGLPFVFASGAEFVESSTGNGSDKIFEIFFTARANAPAFIFIDEIDALAGKNVNDDAERRATFQQLLAELDGEPDDTDVDRFSSRQAVVLICATNRPDELDESFRRPGRIDREIHIGLPGEKERISIFGVHSKGSRLANDVNFSRLVYRTIGYSGADIRNLINEAGIMAVRNGHEEVTQKDFIDVLDKQLFDGLGMSLTEDEQLRAQKLIPEDNVKLMAVHEAGHILLAHLYPRFDWHAFTHLLPGGSEHALTVFYPRQEVAQQGYTTLGYLRMQMVVAHGGRCAERVIFGEEVSDGGQDDLAKITGIAREISISSANRRLGLLPMWTQDTLDPPKHPDEVDLIPNKWNKPGTQIVNMTPELSELFTREVTRYIDETEDQAMEALIKNRHILEQLADELLVKIKMSGFEAEDFIRSMDPIMMPDPLAVPEVDDDENVEGTVTINHPGLYEELVIYPAPLHRC